MESDEYYSNGGSVLINFHYAQIGERRTSKKVDTSGTRVQTEGTMKRVISDVVVSAGRNG